MGWPISKPLSPCEGLPLLRRTGGPWKESVFFQLACIADTLNRCIGEYTNGQDDVFQPRFSLFAYPSAGNTLCLVCRYLSALR